MFFIFSANLILCKFSANIFSIKQNSTENNNKGNSPAGAVRCQKNPQGTSTVVAQFVLQIHNKKMVEFEN